MRRIRVLVVDDHGLMIEAVRLALEQEEDIEIVGDARRGADVLPEVARRQPDVVLLDIRMPDVDGLAVLDRLDERYPKIKVVMLSAIDDPEVAQEAIRRGAVAYLDKRTEPGTLASALRSVVAGGDAIPEVTAPTTPSSRRMRNLLLTAREREILTQVASGRTNPEIARELYLSEQTIKYHLTNVYRKLGVKGRTEAVRFVFEHGLLDVAEARSNRSRHSAGSRPTASGSTGSSMWSREPPS
jgi:DNA-binding NarL/FixJ family response regulator